MIRRLLVASRLVVGVGFAATGATAAEFRHPGAAPATADHICTCRYNGGDVELGEVRCLATTNGPRAAQCVMEQNVTSWHPVAGSCPEASLPHLGV